MKWDDEETTETEAREAGTRLIARRSTPAMLMARRMVADALPGGSRVRDTHRTHDSSTCRTRTIELLPVTTQPSPEPAELGDRLFDRRRYNGSGRGDDGNRGRSGRGGGRGGRGFGGRGGDGIGGRGGGNVVEKDRNANSNGHDVGFDVV